MKVIQKNKRFLLKLGGAAVTAFSLLLFLASGMLHASVDQAAAKQESMALTSAALIGNADQTIYYEDVTIRNGETHVGDVIVYTGDVRVEAGGAVEGALLIYSGDIVIEADGAVTGDVVGWSGDATIAGSVGGDLVLWSGDISLDAGANIGGDVSVMSGDIYRDRSVIIAGNVVAGPKLPKLPPILKQMSADLAALPGQSTVVGAMSPDATTPEMPPMQMNRLSRLLLRLVIGGFVTGLAVLLTGLTYYLQPAFVGKLRSTLTTQRPLSFIAGLLLNALLTGLMAVVFASQSFFLAICLAPLSMLAFVLFLALNAGGWAALSLAVGERILGALKIHSAQPLVVMLLGAVVMTGSLAFVWAVGGFMRPVAYLAMLTLSALGGGAFIVQQFNRRRSHTPNDQPATT